MTDDICEADREKVCIENDANSLVLRTEPKANGGPLWSTLDGE